MLLLLTLLVKVHSAQAKKSERGSDTLSAGNLYKTCSPDTPALALSPVLGVQTGPPRSGGQSLSAPPTRHAFRSRLALIHAWGSHLALVHHLDPAFVAEDALESDPVEVDVVWDRA